MGRKKNKEKVRQKSKEYRERNKEKIAEYWRKREAENPVVKFRRRIRAIISKSFSRREYSKTYHTEEILGCTFEELQKYLEQTWENNYGTSYNGEEVHIDHIIPLAEAKTEEDVIKLCHYTNLQYLKPEDNLAKRSKIDWNITT